MIILKDFNHLAKRNNNANMLVIRLIIVFVFVAPRSFGTILVPFCDQVGHTSFRGALERPRVDFNFFFMDYGSTFTIHLNRFLIFPSI